MEAAAGDGDSAPVAQVDPVDRTALPRAADVRVVREALARREAREVRVVLADPGVQEAGHGSKG